MLQAPQPAQAEPSRESPKPTAEGHDGTTTEGVALPSPVRARMERGLGDDFSDVRVHVDDPGVAADYRGGQAVTSGREVRFAPGAYRPSSLSGELLLAHELAHARQPESSGASTAAAEGDANRSALRTVLEIGHPSLAGLPIGPLRRVLGGPGATSSRPRAPQYLACSSEPRRDWEGQGNDRAEAAARTIRARYNERERLLQQETLSEADHRRIDDIEREMRQQIEELRALGIRVPVDELYQHILDETPLSELMQVGIGRLTGADPPTIAWGERRRFMAEVGYLPPSVDVRYRWKLQEGPYQIPLQGASNSSPSAELGPDFWTRWVQDQELGRWTPPDHFRVGVALDVGPTEADREWTPPLSVHHELPDHLEISVSPLAPQARDAPADAEPRVLAGAKVKATPSWLPRAMPRSGGPSHNIWWSIRRNEDQIASGWGMHGGGTFERPGRYVITAEVHPFPSPRTRRPHAAPLLAARLAVEAVSTRSLADQSFDLVSSRLQDLGYDEYRSELAGRVREAELVMRAGSTEEDEVEERHEALVEMQESVRRHMETTSEVVSGRTDIVGGMPVRAPGTTTMTRRRSSTPLPYPESDDQFDRQAYYARALPAVYVHPTVGVPQPLTIFTQLHHDGVRWQAKLVDATTRDVQRHEGSGDHPHAAISAAITDWRDDNEYPAGGHVRYQFRPFPGWDLGDTFSTDSWEKTILEWFDRVLFVAGAVVGVLLMLTPEPTGATKAAGYALLAASVLRGTYSIYQSLDLGRPALHPHHVMEAIGIIASVIGLRGGAQAAAASRTAAQGEALAGRALTQFQVGRGMVYMAGAMDTGTFVYAASEAWPQIRRALRDDASGDDRAALLRIVGQLAVQGLLIIGSNRDLFRGMPTRGTGPPGIAGALAGEGGDIRLPPEGRTRIEGELRRLGAADDIGSLSDVELLTRYQRTRSSAHGDAAAAARATDVEDYVAALRRPGVEPGDAGGRWDWSRFQQYPEGQRWQPGDPIDAPHRTRSREWVYPDYNQQGRYRYWRNRAHFELEARQAGERQRNPDDASDPIRAMSDEDLRAMRDSRTPRSPTTARGDTVELEHQGVPQRVTSALEELGFSSSEARRLSRASDPGNVMPLTPLEHAFFDAYAQYMDAHAQQPQALNPQRTDAQGRTWEYTLLGDERVQRPLSPMSDDEFRGLLDAIERGGHADNFDHSDRTRRLRGWLRREGRERRIDVEW